MEEQPVGETERPMSAGEGGRGEGLREEMGRVVRGEGAADQSDRSEDLLHQSGLTDMGVGHTNATTSSCFS